MQNLVECLDWGLDGSEFLFSEFDDLQILTKGLPPEAAHSQIWRKDGPALPFR